MAPTRNERHVQCIKTFHFQKFLLLFSVFFFGGPFRPYSFLRKKLQLYLIYNIYDMYIYIYINISFSLKSCYSVYAPYYSFQSIPWPWSSIFWLIFLIEYNHTYSHAHTPRLVFAWWALPSSFPGLCPPEAVGSQWFTPLPLLPSSSTHLVSSQNARIRWDSFYREAFGLTAI